MASSKHHSNKVEQAQGLYATREKIYPRIVLGFFTRLKALSGIVLLGIFYLLPWIQWGDRQGVLFDIRTNNLDRCLFMDGTFS